MSTVDYMSGCCFVKTCRHAPPDTLAYTHTHVNTHSAPTAADWTQCVMSSVMWVKGQKVWGREGDGEREIGRDSDKKRERYRGMRERAIYREEERETAM